MTPQEIAEHTRQPHGRCIAAASLALFRQHVLSNRAVPLSEALAQFATKRLAYVRKQRVWVQEMYADGRTNATFAVAGAVDIDSLCAAIKAAAYRGHPQITHVNLHIRGFPDRADVVDPARHYTFEVRARETQPSSACFTYIQ